MNTFHGTNEIIDWLNLISHNNNLLPLLGSFCHGEAWSHSRLNYTGDQNGLIARLLTIIPTGTGRLTNQLRALMTANVNPHVIPPPHFIIHNEPLSIATKTEYVRLINTIRSRAGMDPLTPPMIAAINQYSEQNVRDAINRLIQDHDHPTDYLAGLDYIGHVFHNEPDESPEDQYIDQMNHRGVVPTQILMDEWHLFDEVTHREQEARNRDPQFTDRQMVTHPERVFPANDYIDSYQLYKNGEIRQFQIVDNWRVGHLVYCRYSTFCSIKPSMIDNIGKDLTMEIIGKIVDGHHNICRIQITNAALANEKILAARDLPPLYVNQFKAKVWRWLKSNYLESLNPTQIKQVQKCYIIPKIVVTRDKWHVFLDDQHWLAFPFCVLSPHQYPVPRGFLDMVVTPIYNAILYPRIYDLFPNLLTPPTVKINNEYEIVL